MLNNHSGWTWGGKGIPLFEEHRMVPNNLEKLWPHFLSYPKGSPPSDRSIYLSRKRTVSQCCAQCRCERITKLPPFLGRRCEWQLTISGWQLCSEKRWQGYLSRTLGNTASELRVARSIKGSQANTLISVWCWVWASNLYRDIRNGFCSKLLSFWCFIMEQ